MRRTEKSTKGKKKGDIFSRREKKPLCLGGEVDSPAGKKEGGK